MSSFASSIIRMKPEHNLYVVILTSKLLLLQVACLDLIPFHEESCSGQCSQTLYIENQDGAKMIQMLDLQNNQGLVNPNDTTLPLLAPPLDWEPPPLSFGHLPSSALDFPLLLDNPELIPGLGDASFQDNSGFTQLPENLPFFGLGAGRNGGKAEGHSGIPDSFFDDFPADMFDYLEQPPPPTSSAAW